MNTLTRLVRDESGQGGTEYMVLLASVVAAVLGAAFLFKDIFGGGVTQMGENVKDNLSKGFK